MGELNLIIFGATRQCARNAASRYQNDVKTKSCCDQYELGVTANRKLKTLCLHAVLPLSHIFFSYFEVTIWTCLCCSNTRNKSLPVAQTMLCGIWSPEQMVFSAVQW